MAIPYLNKGSTYVYFDKGMSVPYPVNYERSQSVGRAENLKIKVYDHSLAGTHKRLWKLKAPMDNDAAANHKFSDLLNFITSTVVYSKYQCTYADAEGNTYTVRVISFGESLRFKGQHEVLLILEEDYA